jgi:hypothetical protein
MVGRIDVEVGDLVQLGGKMRIVGQFELTHRVRLMAMSGPYPLLQLILAAFAIAEPVQ